MRDHGRIPCAYWTSAEIQPLAVDPKLLGAYLLTCEHGTIAGAFRLPVGYVADDLKWSSERVSEGFMELSRIGFINRCETSNWVWLRKYLEWNAPENPNQWKAIRKVVALIPEQACWRVDFVGYLSVLSGEKPTPTPNPSETVAQTLSKSGIGIGIGIGEGGADAPLVPHVPHGTGARVIQAGNRLTQLSVASAFDSLLGDWRRDVPECNAAAFAKWIVHVETSGRQMTPAMRLGQAKRLAGNGDDQAQADVVDFCIEQGYKSLIPIGDVRSRTQGMSRGGAKAKAPAQTEAEKLQKIKDSRLKTPALANFREPNPGETSDQYWKAVDDEFKRIQREHGNAPRFVRDLAAAKRVSA